jgi:hypothetical protein
MGRKQPLAEGEENQGLSGRSLAESSHTDAAKYQPLTRV